MLIDFTNAKRRNKTYSGANGGKISIIYNDEQYMLKMPSHANRNENLSYANGCVAEYIGSHIFNMIGIPAQETLLGTFTREDGKEQVVVACKDFATNGLELHDFASLKNTVIDTSRNGRGTDLNEVLLAIEEQNILNSELLRERFWDIFIVDAFIGNWDRHNGNWGFIYNPFTDEGSLAPVYDCGSSLFPQMDLDLMQEVVSNQSKMNHRIFNIPLSALTINRKKLNYFDYISSLENEDCNDALRRIVPNIDMDEISLMIDDISYINDLQKTFYKRILEERKDKILEYSLDLLLKRDLELEQEQERGLEL